MGTVLWRCFHGLQESDFPNEPSSAVNGLELLRTVGVGHCVDYFMADLSFSFVICDEL